MAEKRMFTQKIIDSDAFLDMPLSSQALYFHLNMRADDDGFVNNPKRIQRTIGASEDDLKLLCAKRFVIGFETGVIVIKHWRMHNTLRKDRYNPTQYQEELALLEVKENNAYTERLVEIPDILELPEPVTESVATTWQPSGNHLATQYSKDKISIDKYSRDKGNTYDSNESESIVLLDTDSIIPSVKDVEITKVAYQAVIDLYNSICTSLPKVRSLSDARRKAIKARLNTYTLEDFQAVFENAEASSFLKGSNDRNWTATFDWLIKDANMAKVLEGNYADKQQRYTRKEIKPNWMQPSLEMGQEEMDAIKRLMGTQTVDNNPAIAAEAEAMQQKMREKYGRNEA